MAGLRTDERSNFGDRRERVSSSRKYLTLMIIPHEEGRVRSVRIPYGLAKAGLAAVLLAGLVGVLFLLAYGRLALTAAEAQRLEAENARLRVVKGKVDELAENLEVSERAYRQIREMAGIRTPGATSAQDRAGSRPAGEGGTPADPRPLDEDERQLLARSINTTPRLWPLTKKGFVTDDFNPAEGHTGLDIAVESNTPVLAAADGIVVGAGRDSIYGNYVILQHDASTQTLYGHNALNFVADGDIVHQGDIIAQSGSTGLSTAPHLHFEIRKNGVEVDPRSYLKK
jgi:murein DD-endopeptidase MepM/ murein hydrolase activator NlpD